MIKSNNRLVFKKRLGLNSLEAVICNVALFKVMKEKQFRDSIFISYNEQGVILEAISEKEWERANSFIMDFIKNKRIEVLTYGYQKEVYDQLINKNLKEYTKRLKEQEIQCPYINLIHYQRLRKSCEFMDRERYVDPLLAWEKKNRIHPNFAYLVVEPKDRFDEVKRHILEMLRGSDTPISQYSLRPKQFLVMLLNPDMQAKLSQMYARKEIELHQQNTNILMILYGELQITLPQVKTIKADKRLRRLGYHIIRKEQIVDKIKQIRQQYREVSEVVTKMHETYNQKYGAGYWFIQLPAKTKQTTIKNIQAIVQTPRLSVEAATAKLQKHVVCEHRQLTCRELIHQSTICKTYSAFVNKCQMLIQEYELAPSQLESFGCYLDQLSKYYNASSVRCFGICIHEGKYSVLFDFKARSLESMIQGKEFVDEIQVATVMLHLLYAVNYLHTHDQPRCLGKLDPRFIYFPMCILLPFLNEQGESGQLSFQQDILLVGQLFESLVQEPNEEIQDLIEDMTDPCDFTRIKTSAAIIRLQQIISA